MCQPTPQFYQTPYYTLSIFRFIVACSRLQKCIAKSCAKTGIPHSGVRAPGIPYDWWMATVYFNTYVSHLVSRAESSKHVEHLNPYYTTLFDVWHFKARNCFLRCGGWGGEGVVCADWGIWKDAYRLSPSLFPPFFARSFFSLCRTDRELGTGCFIATLKGIWILPINPAGNNVTSWWRHTMSLCQSSYA